MQMDLKALIVQKGHTMFTRAWIIHCLMSLKGNQLWECSWSFPHQNEENLKTMMKNFPLKNGKRIKALTVTLKTISSCPSRSKSLWFSTARLNDQKKDYLKLCTARLKDQRSLKNKKDSVKLKQQTKGEIVGLELALLYGLCLMGLIDRFCMGLGI